MRSTKINLVSAVVLIFILICMHVTDVRGQTDCAWDESGLSPWSDPATWPNGLPGENDEVVIPAGKRVLLNIQPPTLATLTIPAGSALIWGDVEGVVLRTHYILVRGEFIMGTRLCRFRKNAKIQLLGLTNSTYKVPGFGRKFIGVDAGGSLSIQGKRMTSWTRLAQTVKPLSDLNCSFVYDHSDHETNLFGKERQNGLHVIVWNRDGSVFDFNVFDDFNTFDQFFQTVPDNTVIAMVTFGTPGIGNRNNSRQGYDILDSVVEQMGGSLIKNVHKYDFYSFIAKKGFPAQTKEHYKFRGQVEPEEEGYLRFTDWTSRLDYQVATSSATNFQYFRILSTEAAYPVLSLADEVRSWSIGDRILVTSTDYDWTQAEVKELIRCPECSSRQVRVNETFTYMHYGNITHGVDERAEVAMLTRSIVIEGVMEDECYANSDDERTLCDYFGQDTFGGHIKVLRGHASAHVVGVELYHMGQQSVTGAYPLHFHMCGEAEGSYFLENSIHHSFSRCVTIHGTDKVEVSGNVCYDHLGHGFFLEDSVEQNNVLNDNVGVGTRHGTLLMSDMTRHWCAAHPDYSKYVNNCDELATFWITHPNNELSSNVAAGGDGHGFMYVFADLPLTLSYHSQEIMEKVPPYSAKFNPIKTFFKNVGHSNYKTGLFMDSKISTGRLEAEGGVPENGILQEENLFDPRNPPNENGTRIWTTMKRLTFYKNIRENMWLKGGNVRVVYSSMADSPEGFTGGTTGTETGTEVAYSVFIGQTDNLGEPRFFNQDTDRGTLSHQFNQSFAGLPYQSLTAVALYQGPVFVKNCFFDRYVTWFWDDSWTKWYGSRPVRPAGAISWKRSNTYPTMTSTYVTNLTFGYCDNVGNGHWVFHGNDSTYDWEEKDGNLAAYVRDADGSLTGTPNAALVRNFPIYKGDECLDRPDWGMSVCPYRYIKMEILGSGGNLAKGRNEKYPIIIRRDDYPYNVTFSVSGQIRREYLLRTHRSYLVDFNTSVPGAGFPHEINVFGYGIERVDVVRVGICMPLDVQSFDIRSDYPILLKNDNATMATSLAELDKDKSGAMFYHDTKNGILFFKLQSSENRNNDSERCPGGECVRYKIRPVGGNLDDIRSCLHVQIPPFVDKTDPPAKPEIKSCSGPASPEGLGAVDYSEIPFLVHNEYQVPCVQPTSEDDSSRGTNKHKGCYMDKYQESFDDNERQEYSNAMTTRWCVDRCFRRSYRFAALTRGRRCLCGDKLNRDPPEKVPDSACSQACSGNEAETCGEKGYLDIWTTGL